MNRNNRAQRAARRRPGPTASPSSTPRPGAAPTGLCNRPIAVYLTVATFEDHSEGSVSYQVLLAVLKIPHHLHPPSGVGMKPRDGKGKQKGSFFSSGRGTTAASSGQRAKRWEPARLLAAPGQRGSSSHRAGAAAHPRAEGAAAGRLRGEGLRLAWGGRR